MQRITLSDSLSVSRIIYGLWRHTDDQDISSKKLQSKIEACLDQGISTFDQADIYGGYSSEALLGETLKQAPHLRDNMEIITKCDIVAPIGIYSDKRVKHYDTSAQHINFSVERSLSQMAIDQIDLLLLHRPDPLMDAQETGSVLDALVASGKVKGIGVSNFKPWDIDLLQSCTQNRLLTNQIEVSLLHNSAFTNGDLAYLQQHKIAPMAWSPLGGGALFKDKQTPLWQKLNSIARSYKVQPSSVATAWLIRHPAMIMPIMGSNDLQRIKWLSEALSFDLSREEWFELLQIATGKEVT
ncbi:MAG: aldo/keto reductase [Cellvibrionales bacterium]|nr:aldo/keto reductase [Cellvibrionales bacterium]